MDKIPNHRVKARRASRNSDVVDSSRRKKQEAWKNNRSQAIDDLRNVDWTVMCDDWTPVHRDFLLNGLASLTIHTGEQFVKNLSAYCSDTKDVSPEYNFDNMTGDQVDQILLELIKCLNLLHNGETCGNLIDKPKFGTHFRWGQSPHYLLEGIWSPHLIEVLHSLVDHFNSTHPTTVVNIIKLMALIRSFSNQPTDQPSEKESQLMIFYTQCAATGDINNPVECELVGESLYYLGNMIQLFPQYVFDILLKLNLNPFQLLLIQGANLLKKIEDAHVIPLTPPSSCNASPNTNDNFSTKLDISELSSIPPFSDDQGLVKLITSFSWLSLILNSSEIFIGSHLPHSPPTLITDLLTRFAALLDYADPTVQYLIIVTICSICHPSSPFFVTILTHRAINSQLVSLLPSAPEPTTSRILGIFVELTKHRQHEAYEIISSGFLSFSQKALIISKEFTLKILKNFVGGGSDEIQKVMNDGVANGLKECIVDGYNDQKISEEIVSMVLKFGTPEQIKVIEKAFRLHVDILNSIVTTFNIGMDSSAAHEQCIQNP
ncbi:uncharacterized protein LOC141855286 [Brevipalpus obovatus]|uniref:uncharacterized protein LOC141855286 n=1 Tax=Brevipalpus obovatus TaxID=246614 RepID=UPI003D9EE193